MNKFFMCFILLFFVANTAFANTDAAALASAAKDMAAAAQTIADVAKSSPSAPATVSEVVKSVDGQPVGSMDEAKQVLKEFAMVLLESAREAKDFAMEQAPLVCKEIVYWGIAYHGYHVAVGIFFFILAFILLICRGKEKSFKNVSFEDKYGHLDGSGFLWLGRSFLGVLCVIIGMNWFVHIESLIKAYFAPRLFIIEYLMNFVGKVV